MAGVLVAVAAEKTNTFTAWALLFLDCMLALEENFVVVIFWRGDAFLRDCMGDVRKGKGGEGGQVRTLADIITQETV